MTSKYPKRKGAKPINSKRQKISDFPKLVLEWHPSKNEQKKPENYGAYSKKKFWWKCSVGHEWQTNPGNRLKGNNCPYCSGNLASPQNNITTTHPLVVAHWNYEKNSDDPKLFLPGSQQKVWWLCEQGHAEFTAINKRTKRRHPCPVCLASKKSDLARRAKSNYNLSTEYPELVVQWDYKKNKNPPQFYSPGSNDKVFWKCDFGHEWEAVIYSRSISGHGCPYCDGQRVTKENSLGARFPELAKEWDYKKNAKTPFEVAPFSDQKAWWACSRGHSWQAVIGSRSAGRGCPKCNSQTSKNEIRILAELRVFFPDILSRHKIAAQEVDIFIPSLNLAIEYDGSFWHDSKAVRDAEKQSIIEGEGIKLIRVREEPLPKIRPWDLLVQKEKLLSKSDLNLILKALKYQNAQVDKYLLSGEFQNEKMYRVYLDNFPSPFPEKSLKVLYPKISKEWHPTKNFPLTPLNFTANNAFKAWWLCEKGHEWEAVIYSRTNGTGCPTCAGKTYTKSQKLLRLKRLKALAQKNGGELLTLELKKAKEKVEWKCSEGHTWLASSDQVLRGSWCPECAGFDPRGFQAKLKDYAASKGGRVVTKSFNSKGPVEFECSKGHRWKVKGPSGVLSSKTWCKICNQPNGNPLTIEEMREMARTLGGKCLSDQYVNSNTKLKWECSEGHIFEKRPTEIRHMKQWCKICRRSKPSGN